MKLTNIRIRDVKISLKSWQGMELTQLLAKKLGLSPDKLHQCGVVKKAVDARKRNDILLVFTFDVKIDEKWRGRALKQPNVTLVATEPIEQQLTIGSGKLQHPPVIVGAGPAGLFAALLLARYGYRPLLLERGDSVEERTKHINEFWQGGQLRESSNVQFGEGGAGTFSDGKLTTRIKDHRTSLVLQELVQAGAPEEILYLQKPHLGTDNLARIVKNIRQEIIRLGGQVFFNSQVTDIILEHNRVAGIKINNKKYLPVDQLILAIGHSARDTFALLQAKGLVLEQKPFAMGVRIEHPQQDIDVAQYGSFAGHEQLGAADYQLVHKCEETGKTAYTFCMCPGGQVVAAASEKGGVVTNGMSSYARNTGLANSALVVSVSTEDFASDSPLAGIELQRQWEQKAFRLAGGNYCAPAQTVGDFLQDQKSSSLDDLLQPSYMPGVTGANLHDILPKWATETMESALRSFGSKLKGFDQSGAVLTGVETRTSSPLRILRDENHQAMGIDGIYPAGEGAGYAGGIMSAAVDGVRVAEGVIANWARPQEPVHRDIIDITE